MQIEKLQTQIDTEDAQKLIKSETITPVKTDSSSTAATKSQSLTPVKSTSSSYQRDRLGMLKDSEIKTSEHIKQVPRDIEAFKTTVEGNREDFIAKIKDMCIDRDFRARVPYSDRFDRDGFL